MLFSISETGWWLIAVVATAFFMVSMRDLINGMEIPEELRSTLGEQNRQGLLALYVLTPVIATIVTAISMLTASASEVLFLYSVAFFSIPIALLPVRARLFKATIAQLQSPGIKIKPDRLLTAWIVGFLCTVVLVAVIALMSTQYGTDA